MVASRRKLDRGHPPTHPTTLAALKEDKRRGRTPYSVLEIQYVKLLDSHVKLQRRVQRLKALSESSERDRVDEGERRRGAEHELHEYVRLGSGSLKGYNDVVALCAKRLRLAGEEELAERVEDWLNEMRDRIIPVADTKGVADLLQAWCDPDRDEAAVLMRTFSMLDRIGHRAQ